MFSTTNVSDKWNVRGFERMLSYEQYPEEKSRLWLSSFKKIDQPSWRTTQRNYKGIPQIVCILSRFRVLHLLSWEFEPSKILWRYTVILVCYLKHVEVGDLHETILTSVSCHKHVRYHDGVTLYFSVKFPSVAPKKTRNGYFSYVSADFRFLK